QGKVELAVLECQHQLHSRCWDCSTLQGLQLFGKATIMTASFPPCPWTQSAFIQAISAASIAFAVTQACSLELHECGCHCKIRGVSPEGGGRSGWQRGRSMGETDQKRRHFHSPQAFVNSPERSCGVSSSQVLMNLHSNEPGRKEKAGTGAGSKPGCRGFSLSRQSSVQPPHPTSLELPEEKSLRGTEVYPKQVGSHKLLVPKSSHFKPYMAHDLGYLRASPFCDQDLWH
ncbi:WNT4 protein, partial [Regulus satrapa]|nr:WNT4 protein [Regulus satrapa]